MLTVGVTFFLRKGERSIWSNGADQNCVFLWKILKNAKNVGRVFAINGGDGEAPPAGMMLGGLAIEFVKMEDVLDQLDVLIEAGAQVSAEHVAAVRARGGRTVGYKFGNAFVIDGERVIHGKDPGSIFNGACFDAIWTNPQHVLTCASYWEACYRAPVYVLPHIWDPYFVDATVKEFPEDLSFGYKPGNQKKRISIFEPNINMVKTSMIPMLICEQACRRRPDLLEAIYVTNTKNIMEHLTFKCFAGNLDIVKSGLASFEDRYNTPWFLAKYTDVVVAHQWQNALNYLYYDVLYGGYPLLHNSDMLPKGVGYAYKDFNVQDGGDALVATLLTHDTLSYQKRAMDFLQTVSTNCVTNILAHEEALDQLWA